MSFFSLFWVTFATLTVAVAFCNHNYCMLKDTSNAGRQPYSWARVQLAWWSIIVLSSFISILIYYQQAPELWQSTVILLGISAATITAARAIDITDNNNQTINRHQDTDGSHFLLDILSDNSSVSIHRFQAVIFNLIFGIYFMLKVAYHAVECNSTDCINTIMPNITDNNLILLGLSSATYAALKMTENKTTSPASTSSAVASASSTESISEEQPVG